MKLRRKHHFAAEVSTSSLNDIMFFLLLFFLIISTVSNPNVLKVMLPKAANNQTISKIQLALTITADKRYHLDGKYVPPEELEGVLKEKAGNVADATLVLRLDKSLTVQDLVDILSIGKKLKIKVLLATEK